MSKDEIAEMLQRIGFKKIKVKELNYNWSAAPPLFWIDRYLPSLPEGEREEAREAWNEAMKMAIKWGEVSPPALLVKATK